MKAVIESVQEINGQYGLEKVSAVTIYDGPGGAAGTHTKVYTKPKAQAIYAALQPGLTVILKPKSGGAGWLVDSIDTNTPAVAPAPPSNGQAPAGGKADPQVIGNYIKTAAGQYAYCVKMLQEKFKEAGITDITDDLLKAGATSIFIAVKDKFH